MSRSRSNRFIRSVYNLARICPLFLFATGAAAAPVRPNLIFITSDDHRWDALGAAGHSGLHTPVLDRLAAEGVYFRQATTHVSQCLPVRATLLTGLTVHQHGAWANQSQSPEAMRPDAWSGLPTVANVLRDAGYRTALVGKWHLEAEPWLTGFTDVRIWLPHHGAEYRDPELARGRSREIKKVEGFTQQILADDAIAFLRGAEAKEKPFLLWLAFTAPHVPLAPNPPEVQKLYAGKTREDLLSPGFPRGIPTGDWLHYAEAVSDLDRQIGRVLAALAEAKLDGPTLVLFSGDNGFLLGQRGMGVTGAAGKIVPYEGSIRVPMILWAPHLPDLAGPADLAASTLDIPPTLLHLAGINPPDAWPGRDLVAALRRDRNTGLEDAFSEWADERSERWGKEAFRMVRTPRHKLIVWKDPARHAELYDLAADPQEEKNLIDAPDMQAVRKDLEARLRQWMERTADPAREWNAEPPSQVPASRRNASRILSGGAVCPPSNSL
ncbi:MAG TPA: sulfatase-like hydrolase/transferase [Thermoanaerobaculia bacterium]|nr:sulfatase-like hydrolase/transferase [Thermoanaerobaculia bacterium]